MISDRMRRKVNNVTIKMSHRVKVRNAIEGNAAAWLLAPVSGLLWMGYSFTED